MDGAIRIKDLVPRLKELGVSACAITDHGVMGGTIEFQKALKKEDLHPLIGCEIYTTEDVDDTPQDLKNRDNLHAVVLCKDNKGMRRLFKLLTEAASHNFYYKPRIHRPKLEELAGHVVLTTACLKGILAGHIVFNRDEYGVVKEIGPGDFLNKYNWYKSIFKDDFYLELQDWDDETHIQSIYNQFLLNIRAAPSSYILTTDAHYLKKEDHELHEIMMASQLKMTLEQYRSQEAMRYGPHFYIKSPEEMLLSAKKWGINLEATNEVADKCKAEIELGIYHPPVFDPTTAPDYQDFLDWKRLKDERS